jgi:hypothetical protein
MQKGDYIVCNYTASSGVVGTFSNFGGTVGTEIPVASTATPNGSFYFIKAADKGLLIADRSVQYNIPWDTLNAGKLIQGLPWDTGDIMPTMSADTSGAITVSASSVFNATYSAYKAFNDVWVSGDTNRWFSANGVNTGWLKIDLGTSRIITAYTLSSITTPTAGPSNWTFEGSNTGAFAGEQVILDTVVSGPLLSARTVFRFKNSTAYRYYRINVTKNAGYASALTIDEMELLQTAGIIRSLSGGSGAATVDGQYAGAITAYGGFPTINEWDKYIVNSTLGGKITAGSDSVWHWTSTATWTQDTYTAYGNTQRVARGQVTVNTIDKVLSSFSGSVGFRPVLEYLE